MNNNRLYILVGASGSGKSTLGSKMFGYDKQIISTTTRPKRDGEHEGEDYRFVSESRFLELLLQDQFAEYDKYDGNLYGILKTDITDKLEHGDAYAILTYGGYEQIKKVLGDRVISVFVKVPKFIAEKMLEDRGESPKAITKRLALFEKDNKSCQKCDYVIYNYYSDRENMFREFSLVMKKESEFNLCPPKYVAIDFDGTIVEEKFPDIGDLKPHAKEVINKFHEKGGRVLINTCRDGKHEAMVNDFLISNGIKFDTLNKNHPEMIEMYKNNPRKLGADLYIDDKGYGVKKIDWCEIAKVLGVKL